MTGIEGVGAYAPDYRIDADEFANAWGEFRGAGISQKAVPDADEDALTMAYEAGSLALAAADREGEDLDGLMLGTTTPPVEEEALPPRLASTLGLPDDVETRQLTGSTRAGTDAVVAALDAAASDGAAAGGAGATYLVVASDAPRGAPDDSIEHAAGAGAAALVIGPDGPGAVLDRAERVDPRPGTRFRSRGSTETTGLGVTEYDRDAFRETVGAAADALDGDLADDRSDVDAVALQSPDGKLPYRAAGALGVDADAIQAGTTVHDLGDTGAASPLLGVASALAAGHADLAAIGYGSGGGATALWIDGAGVPVRAALDGDATLTYAEYLRIRGEITPGEPPGGGAYVSVPSWTRTIPQRHRLVAGRCRECGTPSFPPSGACGDCGTLDEYEPVELPGTGTVEAVTEIGQGGAPPEFVEQQARSGSYVSAIVALDSTDDAEYEESDEDESGNDGNENVESDANESDAEVSTPAQVLTVGGESVEIGDRVDATIRRIYTQEGVTRYGTKFRPLDE